MDISSVKKGDVIEVQMRGWTFLAYVDEIVKKKGEQTMLMITPDKKNCTHRHCYAHDVKKHYKRMKRQRVSRKTSNGSALQLL